jgi:hypothetical protein
MVHFSPVHPERVQIADLRSGKTSELYPTKGDVQREQLIKERAKHLPPDAACVRANDPCRPELFDEDVWQMGTDGKGNFAFLIEQSPCVAWGASAAQNVLYIYQRGSAGWHFCERKVADSEREALGKSLVADFGQVARRCKQRSR